VQLGRLLVVDKIILHLDELLLSLVVVPIPRQLCMQLLVVVHLILLQELKLPSPVVNKM